eukprot:5615786-Ditylum_brightwellii.AAC.2
MYTIQGIKHSFAIMNHGKANTTPEKHLRANIEAHKVELGTKTSLFATDYNIFHHCATFTWFSWTWEDQQ